MKRLLLTYDTPGWACQSEARAIAKALKVYAPGEFDVDQLQVSSAHDAAFLGLYDVVFSTIEYFLAESDHPRSASQCSSYDYWTRKASPAAFPGWPENLKRWKWIVGKNRDIFSRLTDEDHPRRRLLYHALDWTHFSPGGAERAAGPLRVGFAGHAEQATKGVDLIRAAVDLVPGCELAIETWGRDRRAWADMPDFYRSLDVYVCASQPGADAGPRSALEAGLCGLPVVTTRVGQIAEVVEDGRSGFVVDRTPEAIATALEMLRDERLRLDMAAQSRATFEAWARRTAMEWVAFMREVAST